MTYRVIFVNIIIIILSLRNIDNLLSGACVNVIPGCTPSVLKESSFPSARAAFVLPWMFISAGDGATSPAKPARPGMAQR